MPMRANLPIRKKSKFIRYRVIYEAIDDIQSAMKGMLAPKYKEVIQGKVEIRQGYEILQSTRCRFIRTGR